MTNHDPFSHIEAEPEISVLPRTEADKLYFALYWGAKRKIVFPEMEALLKWVEPHYDTPKELILLKHLKRLWDEGKLNELRAISETVSLHMAEPQNLTMAA